MMIDIDKNYWLYIAPYVYCTIKTNHALLYNTRNEANMVVDDSRILALLQSMHQKENLGAIRIEGEVVKKTFQTDFLSEFCEKEMGEILEIEKFPEKPIQLMPVLNLQRDVEKTQKMAASDLSNNYLSYLSELTIYLCNDCSQNCLFCDNYFKQNLCCKTESYAKNSVIDITLFEKIIAQLQHKNVGKLNLLGGNVFSYPHYGKLPDVLKTFRGQIHIWNHYGNFKKKNNTLNYYYDIIVTYPLKEKSLEAYLQSFDQSKLKFHFYITNEIEYEKTESVISGYKLKNYSIKPVYTGNNSRFFEEYVYTGYEDIFQEKPTFRHIFAHQKLNTHFFGLLTVFSNGDVYANVNAGSLGNISEVSLTEIIDKEMQMNTAWRKTRDSFPCSECLYQYICPSPSNYETVINRTNLCHLKIQSS